MSRIVGIDLGTSTCELAVFELGKPRVVDNDQGKPVTPSAIWASPSGELITGLPAYKQPGAVREYKRKMGSAEKLQLGSHSFAPQECSALMLKYLLKCGEDQLREEVDRAVITVPANWKEGPRRATEEAGALSGIRVERLINEPTAAAMAFGARPEAEGKTIAVYDFGGGTFDVTILKIHQKIFDVMTSVGDDHLGGSDIDQLLIEYVIEETTKSRKYAHRLGDDPKLDHTLKMACEEAKKELSYVAESHVHLPFLGVHDGNPISVDVTISRAQLDRMIEPLVDRSLTYLREALRQAKLDPSAIDEIVMVGGSTRIPVVRQRVAELLDREPNTADVNPDEAVALGAAIQASVLDESSDEENGFFPLDVTNNNLGVETVELVNDQPVYGVFSPIILKNTKLPVTRTERYATMNDNQTVVKVKCYQGNGRMVSANEMIGEPIVVSGLPTRPAGEVAVEITFSLTASEILDVGVQIDEAGIMSVHNFELGGGLRKEEEIDASRGQIDALWQRSELAGRYKLLISRVEEVLSGGLDQGTRGELEAGLEQLKQKITDGAESEAAEADVQISNLLFDLE